MITVGKVRKGVEVPAVIPGTSQPVRLLNVTADPHVQSPFGLLEMKPGDYRSLTDDERPPELLRTRVSGHLRRKEFRDRKYTLRVAANGVQVWRLS